MVELDRQVKGAIGEYYVLMRMLAKGYTAANINMSVGNAKFFDIICGNPSTNKFVPVQVKSSFNGARSFNLGLSHKHFLTDGAFDDAKAMQALHEKIRCPWIFVNVDTSSKIPQCTLFIMSQEQVIKLAFESEKWYINDVERSGQLSDNGTVALALGWIEGHDTSATNKRRFFKNPFSVGRFEEAWENLGLE